MRWMRQAACLVVCGVFVAPAAEAAKPATGPDQALRVLPEGVEKAVASAFQRAAPAWRLDSAKIQKVQVKAKVCTAEGACHELVLSDPKRGCASAKPPGTPAGPWCLRWPGTTEGAAPAGAETLVAALAKDADGVIWRTIPARPKQPKIGRSAAGQPLADLATQVDGAQEGTNGEDGDSTLLLLAALVAAAAATFVLFRRGDDEEDGEKEDGAAPDSDDQDGHEGHEGREPPAAP